MSGYLPNTDRIDRLARKSGLPDRLALVLHTYRPDATDMVFDVPLSATLVVACTTAIAHDRQVIERLNGHHTYSFDDWKREELRSREPAPFSRARLEKAGEIVAVWLYQPYDAVGGPAPYHDAVVLELFATKDSISAARLSLDEAVTSLGLAPMTVKGSPRESISIWQRFRRIF